MKDNESVRGGDRFHSWIRTERTVLFRQQCDEGLIMNFFEHRYVNIDVAANQITLAPKPGTIRKRVLPLVVADPLQYATATLDDPGAVKRGFTLTTGMIGRNKDKGSVFLTVMIGQRAEVVEIPRKYGAQAREAVATINAVGR